MAADSPRSERLRRMALMVWTTLGALALVWVFIRVADSVRIIWLPLAFAGGFTLLLNPLVNSLERVHVPRLVGTVFAFLVAGSVISAIVVLLVPTIREQGSDLATTLPNLYGT
ncbi:MAG TPA: AI-2E family transporter, partial [Acidimicrobiia bacterium]|nr:AI-2E family transporter [Acidimicrobiia bacterium]